MENDFELKPENFCYYIDDNYKVHLYVLNNDRTMARSKKSIEFGVGGHEIQNISAKNFVNYMETFYRTVYDRYYENLNQTAMIDGIGMGNKLPTLTREINSEIQAEVETEKNRILDKLKKVFGVEHLDVVGNSWISNDAKYNLNAFKYCFKDDVCFLVKHKTMERILGYHFNTDNVNSVLELKELQNRVQSQYDKYMAERTKQPELTEDDIKEENEK